MRLLKLVIFFVFFINIANANVIVDVYGVDKITEEKIIKKYRGDIIKITELMHSSDTIKDSHNFKKNHDYLVSKIKKEFNFHNVAINPIKYFNTSDIYTTVDIDPNKPKQLKATKKTPRKSNNYIPQEINELIAKWEKYEESSLKKLIKKNTQIKCPVYHCVFSGFQSNEDFELLEYFKKTVSSNKDKLIKILESNTNEIQRGRVAFLLAHLDSPDEIISIMLNNIDDKSVYVRNNTMRVLSETMRISKKTDIKLDKVVGMLSSSLTTDRNKAGGIILVASMNKSNHQYIIDKAGNALIKMLQLKQPNNHDTAYLILKSISNQNYQDTDIESWKSWLLKNSKS